MTLYQAVMAILKVASVGGLVAAYFIVAAGLTGYLDAGRATSVALGATAIALIAIVAYFGLADIKLSRRERAEHSLFR